VSAAELRRQVAELLQINADCGWWNSQLLELWKAEVRSRQTGF
jgi:hypothetical protein